MRSFAYHWLQVLTLLVATAASHSVVGQESPPLAPAAKTLAVEVASGRTFTGQVDTATDDKRLVMRISRADAHLRRPIEWMRITKMMLDGKVIESARWRDVATGLKSAVPRVEFASPSIPPEETPAPATSTAKIAYVTFDARLANWDADVEVDGILIDVFPVDADGYLAPASGTLEVELFAQQRRDFQEAPQSGGRTLERMERWTREVAHNQYGANGVRLKLPFGAVHPEFDQDWLSMGLVHVKFAAPGRGVFEDSRDAVRIRPFAPNRDYLDMHTGRRFMPTEGVGRRD